MKIDILMELIVLDSLDRDTRFAGALKILRDAIINSTYPPGTQLKQSVIAEQLGISQGPVREALNRLIEEGLVENVPFHGYFVRQLSQKDVIEIYHLRDALECLAARLALPKLKEKNNWEQLRQHLQNNIDFEAAGKYDAALISDLAFHRFIVTLSGNAHLIKIWDSLLAQFQCLLFKLYALEVREMVKQFASNHYDLLLALECGDIHNIQAEIKKHMEFGASTLLENWASLTK